ncbi:hypothetical protein [Pedobacter steynii]
MKIFNILLTLTFLLLSYSSFAQSAKKVDSVEFCGIKYPGPTGCQTFGNVPDHHEQIATDYVAFLTAGIRAVYPNTSLRDAWALAWGGLEETSFYKKKLTQAERTEIQTILANYKKSAAVLTRKGTYCNP